jgi:hypothetical protein
MPLAAWAGAAAARSVFRAPQARLAGSEG